MLTKSPEDSQAALSRLKFSARALYSNPPRFGAHLVDIVLSERDLRKEWHRDLMVMSNRLSSMRQDLYKNLVNKGGSEIEWAHITKQIGMFAFTGLTKEQCQKLRSKHHIYLTDCGRMSLSGLTKENVEYVAQSIHDVTKTDIKSKVKLI